MKNIRNYSTKEKILISFSFWPTLLIGIALGLTIALLMLQNPQPIYLLISQIKFIVVVLVVTWGSNKRSQYLSLEEI